MSRVQRTVFLVLVSTVGAGCGLDLSGITGSTSLSDALNQLAQQVAADPTLSQLTVSDVVEGFAQYAGQDAGPGMMPPPLTPEQLDQLEALQDQLDSGEITEEEFGQQVEDLIGDLAPGHAFAGRGMMGGPFPHHPALWLANKLQLTEEQRAQAKDILDRLHDDIATLRQSAIDQIKAVFTAEQLAQLEELRSGPRGPEDTAAARGMRRGGHMGPRGNGLGLGGLAGLAKELQLTDEQIAAIKQIRVDLRDAIAARHQQARDEFRATLTAEQLAILDQLEADREPPPAED